MADTPDWRALQARHEALLADVPWRIVLDRRGVRGAVHPDPPDGVPMVRCDTALACAPETLARFLVHDILQTLPSWNPVFDGGAVLEDLGDGERILRLVNRLPWPLRRREDVFFNACKTLEDGTVVELSTTVEHEGAPVRADMIRSGLRFATKRMTPRPDGGCDYTALWHYDLRGVLGRMPVGMLSRSVLGDLAKEHDRLRERFGVPKD